MGAVSSMKPLYLTFPTDTRNDASCSEEFKYIVKVPQQNYQTGNCEMSQFKLFGRPEDNVKNSASIANYLFGKADEYGESIQI